MKLFELITTPVKGVSAKVRPYEDRRTGPRPPLYKNGTKSPKSNKLGSGHFASVEQHKNLPPGMVVKYGRVLGDIDGDGYVNYLKQISKSDRMARNPYLPRIYSVKIIDNSQYAVVMEELHPFNSCDIAEYELFIDRLFGSIDNAIRLMPQASAETILSRKRKGGSKNESGMFDHSTYRSILSRSLHRAFNGNSNLSGILDPKFKEAAMIIKQLKKVKGASVDIHAENIMVRRGPTGAQLVITDPLA